MAEPPVGRGGVRGRRCLPPADNDIVAIEKQVPSVRLPFPPSGFKHFWETKRFPDVDVYSYFFVKSKKTQVFPQFAHVFFQEGGGG